MIQLLLNDIIIGIMFTTAIIIAKRGITINLDYKDAMTQQKKRAERNKEIINYMDLFLRAKQNKVHFEDFFIDKGIKSIAIYGGSHLGRRLCDELNNESRIKVKYIIDRNSSVAEGNIPIYGLDDEWKPVDAIVVSVIGAFDEIKKLFKDLDTIIINIEDVLQEINTEKDI